MFGLVNFSTFTFFLLRRVNYWTSVCLVGRWDDSVCFRVVRIWGACRFVGMILRARRVFLGLCLY